MSLFSGTSAIPRRFVAMCEQICLTFRPTNDMETYDDAWVTAQVAHTVEAWYDSAWRLPQRAHLYGSAEQENREQAYDEALQAAEQELRLPPETRPEHRRH